MRFSTNGMRDERELSSTFEGILRPDFRNLHYVTPLNAGNDFPFDFSAVYGITSIVIMAPPKGALSFAPPAPGSPFSFSTQPSFQPSSSNPPTFSFSNSDDFAPKTSPPAQTTPINAMNGEGNVNSDGSEKEQEDASTLYLEPAAWSRREKAKWKATGRTVMAAVSPVEGEVAAWVAKKVRYLSQRGPLLMNNQPASDPNKPPTLTGPRMALPDRTLLFASPHVLSDPLINLYTETYTLFTSLQRIVSSSFRLPSLGAADAWDNKGNLVLNCLLGPPGAETVGHMRRLVMMYIEELAKLRGTPDLGVSDTRRVRLTRLGGDEAAVRCGLPYLPIGRVAVPSSGWKRRRTAW
jgi:hypothetical protein